MYEETVENMCETYRLKNTHGGEHVWILDPCALMSLIERQWLSKYLAEFDYKVLLEKKRI